MLQSGTAGSVSFKWQRSKNGTDWVDIIAGLGQTDSGVTYTNFSSTNTLSYLTLSAAPISINGYKYRIVSTNASGYAANSNAVSLSINIAPTISIQPANWMLAFVFKNAEGEISSGMRTLFLQDMIARGVLFQGAFIPCFSHTEEDVTYFTEAFKESLEVYAHALKDGYEKYLIGKPAKPVFRKKQ